MLILKNLMLWGLVSVNVVGAAFLFRRLFPCDSRWLAFVLPEILFVVLCNFLEHHVALTALRLLLPVTTVVAVGALAIPGSPWRTMRLPTVIFLAAFAFTLTLRALRPAVMEAQDGVNDLSLVANFLYGQTLPAESTWMPPVPMLGYYCFEQYAASVLTRFFGVEIGTGFNFSNALLSAYIYFFTGAIAWHLSRGKIANVVLCLVLTAATATGCSGYIWLTVANPCPDYLIDPYSLSDIHPPPDNFLQRHLTPLGIYDRHAVLPPGFGGWIGYLHSAQAGQMLIGLFLLALIEALRRRRTDAPWPLLAVTPLLMLTSCTWGLPMLGFLATTGIIAARRLKTGPRRPARILMATTAALVLLEPLLVYFLQQSTPFDFDWVTDNHTQALEFLAQWWPIYLPGILLAFAWKHLHPVTRMTLFLAPLAFAGAETWTAGNRIDATEKFWALIFAAAWMTFLPELIRQHRWAFRLVLFLITVNALLAFGFWTTYYARVVNRAEIAHLDGLGQFRLDRRKARILEVVSRLPGQTILPGVPSWACAESGLLPLFSHTRAYVTWYNFCDSAYFPNGIGEGWRRAIRVYQLYDGTMTDPLIYLRQRGIAALVINPDDRLAPALVAQLRTQLAPYYTYEDANRRQDPELRADTSPGNPAAGVFVYHPEITTLLGKPKAKGE